MNVSSKSSVIMCVCCRYVVDRRWFDQWKEFVETGDQNSTSFPGQIDNAELFEGQLRFVCFSKTQNDVFFSEVSCPAFRSGLVPPEGSSGGGRGLCAGAGRGVAQAAGLVRHSGRSATARTQGNITTCRAVP